MKRKNQEDIDFDFELPIKKNSNEEEIIDEKTQKGDHLIIGDSSLDLSDDCLIIRKVSNGGKEKILIDLLEIKASQTKMHSHPVFLFLAIFLLVVSIGGCIPTLFFYPLIAYIILVVGIICFIIFITLFFKLRNMSLIIKYGSRDRVVKFSKNTKSFKKLNDFLDEVYEKKHRLIKK